MYISGGTSGRTREGQEPLGTRVPTFSHMEVQLLPLSLLLQILLPPSAVLMERYDSTKPSQLSGTTNTPCRRCASSPSSAGGPQVRRSQFVSPHQERMVEEMTVMATQSQQVIPTPLLSNAVAPVTSHVATFSGDAITRRTTPMNDSLVAELKKMVGVYCRMMGPRTNSSHH